MTRNDDFKIIGLVLVCIVTLGLCLGGYYLYFHYNVEEPLVAELEQIEKVDDVEINRSDNIYQVSLKLDLVENIQDEYLEIQSIIEKYVKGKQYTIELKTDSNKALNQIYFDVQPVIYEALSNNRYVWMKDEIEKMANLNEIDFNMFIDETRVYMQFSQGSAYYYRIIERNNENLTPV